MHLPPRPSSITPTIAARTRELHQLAWPDSPSAEVIPNLSAWLPGDILVMSTLSPTSAVRVYQARQSDKQIKKYADWTHCAVYIGHGLMVDTMPKNGARVRRVFPETSRRTIAVRRPDPSQFTDEEALNIAEIATAMEDIPYTSYLRLGLGNGFTSTGANGLPKELYCSSLVFWAADQAGVPLTIAPNYAAESLPACLMFHPNLVDIDAAWHPPAL